MGDSSFTGLKQEGLPCRPPTHKGFGTRVIASMINQAKGEIGFDWRPEGLFWKYAPNLTCRQHTRDLLGSPTPSFGRRGHGPDAAFR